MLTRGQQQFRDVLAQQLGTPNARRAIGAWLLAEEGGAGGPASGYEKNGYYNYLNIARTDSNLNAPGSHGSYFSSPEKAAIATAQWIKGGGPITKSYGKAAGGIQKLAGVNDQAQFIHQLANSGWASSGYNGGSDLFNLLQQTQGGASPYAASGAPAPATRGHATTRTVSPATQQTTTTTTEAPTTGLAGLLSSFQAQQKPVMQSMGVQAPSFSADRYGSSGQVPVSPQASQPKTDYGALIAQTAQAPATTTTQKTVTGANAAVAGATAVTPPKAKPKSGSGNAAVQFASDHLGAYAESQGQNVGPQLNTLEQKFGLTGQPWCAMFATTAAAHGGASRAVRTASVADINQWASQGSHGYQKGLYKTSQARAGDLITFGNDHVGLVTGVDAQGNVHTIEGNTRANRVSTGVHPPNSGTIVKPRYQ